MNSGTLKVFLIVATFTAAALAGPIAAGLERTLSHVVAAEPEGKDSCDSERRAGHSAAADGALLL